MLLGLDWLVGLYSRRYSNRRNNHEKPQRAHNAVCKCREPVLFLALKFTNPISSFGFQFWDIFGETFMSVPLVIGHSQARAYATNYHVLSERNTKLEPYILGEMMHMSWCSRYWILMVIKSRPSISRVLIPEYHPPSEYLHFSATAWRARPQKLY